MNERSLLVVAAKEWDAHRDAKHVDLDQYLLEVQVVEQLSVVAHALILSKRKFFRSHFTREQFTSKGKIDFMNT